MQAYAVLAMSSRTCDNVLNGHRIHRQDQGSKRSAALWAVIPVWRVRFDACEFDARVPLRRDASLARDSLARFPSLARVSLTRGSLTSFIMAIDSTPHIVCHT